MEDKRDSASYSDIYTQFVTSAILLPEHREHLKKKRGFSDETIDRLKFRSCGPHLEDAILATVSMFDSVRAKEAGLIDDLGPQPKFLEPNILIPYLTVDRVTYLRPHKDALPGLRLPVYAPRPLQSFTVLAESEFKAAACLQWGFSSVGIGGVSACAGKNYELLTVALKASGVRSVCAVFDNEIKDNPEYPNYKPRFWDRWDTQYYAYLMARKLEADGYETTIAVLPGAWMENGKIDLDGALAQGRAREDIATEVLRRRLTPTDYLKILPADARALIERRYFKSMLNVGQVKSYGGRYWVERKQGDASTAQPISNFTATIEYNVYDPAGQCTRQMILENLVGEKNERAEFRSEDLNHPLAFKKRCLGYGDYQFSGGPKDLEQVLQYEMARELGKRIHQPDHVGWIRDGSLYLFGNGGLTADGKRVPCDQDGVVWRGLTGYQAIPLHQGGDETSKADLPTLSSEDFDAATLIDKMEANFGGYPAIRLACSWAISAFFSHFLSQIYDSFPLLFITGRAEAGKTTLCEWLSAMFGVKSRGYSFSAGTAVGIQRGMGYYSSLPFWLDEYRNDQKSRDKEGYFRSAYDRQMTLKGTRQAFGVRGGAVRGCLLVSGQDTPSDLALQQRFITIRIKHKSGQHYGELQSRVGEMSGILPRLVAAFHKKRKAIIEAIKTMREFLRSQGLDDRTSITYAIVVGVYDQLIRENDKPFLDFSAEHAKQSFLEKETEKPTTVFLEGLQELKERRISSNAIKSVGGQLAIYFQGAWGQVREMWRRRGDEIPFKAKTILDEFEEMGYFVERGRSVRMGGQSIKCLILDPTKDSLVAELYGVAAEEDK